jgi:hypothetical protein
MPDFGFQIGSAPAGLSPIDGSAEQGSVLRTQIDKKHIEHQTHQEIWFNSQTLYAGGAAMKASADRFLPRRPKEDSTVFQHRLDRFDYENNVGAALGWHEASMFEDEPSIDIKLKVPTVNIRPSSTASAPEPKLTPEQTAFWNDRFLKNCDRQGSTFVNFFRTIFNSMLLYQHAYICVDMPITDDGVPSLQAQKDQNLLDPYLCALTPLDIINWELDEYKNLKWCVLYSKSQRQTFLGPTQRVERWYYYDQQMYRVYEAVTDLSKENSTEANTTAVTSVVEAIQQDDSSKVPVKLTRVGYHVLAKFGMVPIIKVGVPLGWWMANRAYLPAMEHVDVSNVLRWSLIMAGLAVPVLITDDDITTLTASETNFIKLGLGSEYKFAEPSGRVWDELSKRANTLKEEIWRACYLVSMARNTSATAMAASGVSKQQDMQPSHDVLNGIGEILRQTMQSILGIVAKARSTVPGCEADAALTFDVRGYNFEDKASVDDIVVIQDLLDMNVPSDTFYKELCMMAVRAGLKNPNPERLKEIDDQIEAAPTREEQQQQQQEATAEAQQKQMRTQMTGIMKDDPEGA